jgi:hypothetical protein
MENLERLEKIIKEEIFKLRSLGEHERKGSDHLFYRSLSKFQMGEVKESTYQEREVFEVVFKYDIYTETEFLHTPEMDENYTEHYEDKFIFDDQFTLLEIIDLRKKN